MTKNKNSKIALASISALALALGAASGAARAASSGDSGFYLSGDLGQSRNNLSSPTSPAVATDKRGTIYGIGGGYQFNKHFATELSVQRLGTHGIGSTESKTTAYSLDAIGRLPVSDKFAVYGRLGASHLDRKFSGIDGQNAHGVGFKLGLGAEYALDKNWSLRTELTRYNKAPVASTYGEHMNTWTAGVKYRF
ncbi:porin family protein [Kinneretia aquatilis]|uniref:porin family protein n=1 Tax=Kinneretia aquatilis TaxID=2070761 RepID=UPI0014952009|nr:porin family protein [Paucibacter aquatile]WIV96780.1 porin family protein [Paucibacter aquatile]